MDKDSIIGFIFVFMCGLVFALILFGVIDIKADQEQLQNQEQEVQQIQEQECEHDWVVTSKYNFWWQSYQTYSKCSKCGKEVK